MAFSLLHISHPTIDQSFCSEYILIMTLQRRICKEPAAVPGLCGQRCVLSPVSPLCTGDGEDLFLLTLTLTDVSFCLPLNWPLLSLASFCSSSSSSAALWHLLSAITWSGNRVDSSGLHPSSSLSLSLNPSVVWWIAFSFIFCLFLNLTFVTLSTSFRFGSPHDFSLFFFPSLPLTWIVFLLTSFISCLPSPAVVRIHTHTKHQHKR